MFISTRKSNFIDRLWIIIFDVIALWGAIYLATSIRFGVLEAGSYVQFKTFALTAIVFIFLTIIYLIGLYEVKSFTSYRKIIIKTLGAVALGIILNSFIFYAMLSFAIGRGVFILMTILLFVFLSIPRIIYVFIAKKNIFDNKLIVIGIGKAARETIRLINSHPTSLYRIIGIVHPMGSCDMEEVEGVKVLGSVKNMEKIAEEQKADVLVVTTLEPERNNILKNVRFCRYRGLEIADVISLYEELEGRIPLEYIDDEWLFSSNANYPKFHVRKLKRLVDIVVSISGLLITFPLCLIIAGLIQLDSPGPVFYRQKRVGRFGKIFRVLKFRSMKNRAERGMGGPVWAKDNDDRITRIGKFLRKTRIDEIPQLINILFGDMSLVGPRPERPAFVTELTEKIPYYPERLYVQPGLTGWAQINYPYAGSVEETRKKLEYDMYYIKHTSFLLDLIILLRTAKTMVLRRERMTDNNMSGTQTT